jgi:hypothetical protein
MTIADDPLKPAFLTGYRRESAEMAVGEPDKDECSVNARPGEREIHGGISPARQAMQECKAQAARRARENARRRSLHYVEHTTEHDVGTTPGMQDDCRDAGRLQGRRTTAGMQDDCRDAGARATQERLPR